ncbi:hypothetical protein CRUP_010211 [Coryphaenoides rupestris]|nr:hypothetical protein CRUP_010211 [Coryphaenoides rupestris]
MKSAILICLLLLSCLYLSQAQGSYDSCCLGHVRTMRSRAMRIVQRYTLQEADGVCNIRAVVFFLKKRPKREKPQTVCANPNHQWVQNLMSVLDRKQGN